MMRIHIGYGLKKVPVPRHEQWRICMTILPNGDTLYNREESLVSAIDNFVRIYYPIEAMDTLYDHDEVFIKA